MHNPPKNSEESKLVEILRVPKDWLPIEGEKRGDDKQGTDDKTANKQQNSNGNQQTKGMGYRRFVCVFKQSNFI